MLKNIFIIISIFILFLFSCTQSSKEEDTTTTNSTTTTVSSLNIASTAIYPVPSSLTGSSSSQSKMPSLIIEKSSNSITSESLVKQSMQLYYSLVRANIYLASIYSDFIKELLTNIESVYVDGKSIFELSSEQTYTDPETQDKIKWTPYYSTKYKYLLEYWKKQSDSSYKKILEMGLNYTTENGKAKDVDGVVSYSFINDPDNKKQEEGKSPDIVKVEFNSNKNNSRYLKIMLTNFRFSNELDNDANQKAKIELYKDINTNEITVIGSISVPGSRWFIWNGYKKLSGSSDETIDKTVTSEKRYYVFTGKVTADNKATLNLGIAKEDYTINKTDEKFVFTKYSIGEVIKTLYAERLFYDYQFGDTDDDKGKQIIKYINNLLTQMKSTEYLIPENSLNVEKIYKAFNYLFRVVDPSQYNIAIKKIIEEIRNEVIIKYLLYMMEVKNPAYFITNDYTGYGDSVPDNTYISKENLSSIDPYSVTEIESIELNFEKNNNITTPGF